MKILKDEELERQIALSAQYLLEKKERESQMAASFYDHAGLLSKLDSAELLIAEAVKNLQDLVCHFELGHMDQFSIHEQWIRPTYKSATELLVKVHNAKQDVKFENLPKTREMVLQKSAARLAYAIYGCNAPREVRKIAVRIMDKANLCNPEASTLTRWLKEFKREDGNVK